MLKICKTPLRVSFFGGGTDYPEYFKKNPGAVLGTSINLYIYLSALKMEEFCEQRYRLMYSTPESVNKIDDIQHPVIRSILSIENYTSPLNLSVMSDVPSGTGLGSSSTFTVGMLNLIKSLKDISYSKSQLASEATYIEREVLKENVGCQDQLHAAHGGLNLYEFKNGKIIINRIKINKDCYSSLSGSMFLIYTKLKRRATHTVKEQLDKTLKHKVSAQLKDIFDHVWEGKRILEQENPSIMLEELGKLLNETWSLKKTLSQSVSNNLIDDYHRKITKLGAYGSKLCGAGNGGFMLCLGPKDIHKKLKDTFGAGNVLNISIEAKGSQIIYS